MIGGLFGSIGDDAEGSLPGTKGAFCAGFMDYGWYGWGGIGESARVVGVHRHVAALVQKEAWRMLAHDGRRQPDLSVAN